MSDRFIAVLAHVLVNNGIPREQIQQAISLAATFESAPMGSPMITRLCADSTEKASQLVSKVMEILRPDWVVNVPNNGLMLDKSYLNGKTVLAKAEELSTKKWDFLYNQCINKSHQTSLVVISSKNDVLEDRPVCLMLDVDRDTSAFMATVGEPSSEFFALDPKTQATWMRTNLELLRHCDPCFDARIIDKIFFSINDKKIKIRDTAAEKFYTLPAVGEVFGRFHGSPVFAIGDLPIDNSRLFESVEVCESIADLVSHCLLHSKPITSDMKPRASYLYEILSQLEERKQEEKRKQEAEQSQNAEQNQEAKESQDTEGHSMNEVLVEIERKGDSGRISRKTVERARDDLLEAKLIKKVGNGRYQIAEKIENTDPRPKVVFFDNSESERSNGTDGEKDGNEADGNAQAQTAVSS